MEKTIICCAFAHSRTVKCKSLANPFQQGCQTQSQRGTNSKILGQHFACCGEWPKFSCFFLSSLGPFPEAGHYGTKMPTHSVSTAVREWELALAGLDWRQGCCSEFWDLYYVCVRNIAYRRAGHLCYVRHTILIISYVCYIDVLPRRPAITVLRAKSGPRALSLTHNLLEYWFSLNDLSHFALLRKHFK